MSLPLITYADPGNELYKTTVTEAAAGGSVLMGALVNAAISALRAREKSARDIRIRDAFSGSIKLLLSHELDLRAAYPKALLAAFLNPELLKASAPVQVAEVNFDELELMDEVQVHSSVVMARAQQTALLAAEASLAELNTLICGVLGLKSVRPERNPLRPEVYVSALKEVVEQQNIPMPVQLEWLSSMSIALGQELREMYAGLSAKLKGYGVVAAGYSVRPNAGSGARRALFELADSPATAEQPQVSSLPVMHSQRSGGATRHLDPSLLTLDKLRRLLAGELEAAAPASRNQFAQQFARQFESGPNAMVPEHADFDATVPAALEALQEMRQVEQVVQRLEQRKHQVPVDGGADADHVVFMRNTLRREARGIAQALSLEVVTLMIDNIARDKRLLEPVQVLVAKLEPAYLRLSLIDACLFTDKHHPARLLLQEITHRSLAYRSTDATGFQAFKDALDIALNPLMAGSIESAAPFEAVLIQLQTQWQSDAKANARAREEAVEVLQHVEQRNVLAEKIARDIISHRDAASVPTVVIEFLCGPWAHVVAQARISAGSGSSNADKYQALISALLWSTHPELTRKNIAKLTRLVPLLLSTLREGLDTIKYPVTKTAAFLESLMGLHQQAFRAGEQGSAVKAPTKEIAEVQRAHVMPVLRDDPWVAPEEARASNFVQLQDMDDAQQPAAASASPLVAVAAPAGEAVPTSSSSDASEGLPNEDLPLGSWVELQVDGQWVRTQLTWASPHGTLYLFTSAVGTSQSMTRRSRDRLVAAGSLRVISGAPVVDGALNAVAQIALRNSMDNSI